MNLLFYLWKPIIEIIILWFLIYNVLIFFEGTRARHVLRGVIILFIFFILFQKLNLDILDWIFAKIFGISVIAILIIFHPEIRQGLARLGQRHILAKFLSEERPELVLKEIISAVENLSKNKIGAIIAIEKDDSLNSYIESGVQIDSHVSSDLIEAIFTPNNPLHDGGLIISNARISAAGCFFPLADNLELSRIFGTRHRAALGLSEETDAVVIVVSEERRDISLVYKGKLYRDLSSEDLALRIKEFLSLRKDNEQEKK